MSADSTSSSHRESTPSDAPERRHEQLNWLGQAVYAGGMLHRLSRRATEAVQRRASAIASRSTKAFYEGLDPNVDDAIILDEADDTSGTRGRRDARPDTSTGESHTQR